MQRSDHFVLSNSSLTVFDEELLVYRDRPRALVQRLQLHRRLQSEPDGVQVADRTACRQIAGPRLRQVSGSCRQLPRYNAALTAALRMCRPANQCNISKIALHAPPRLSTSVR